jgi:hypothetical protein
MGCGPGGASYKPVKNQWYDPLGPSKGPQSTGATDLRKDIFNYIRGNLYDSTNDANDYQQRARSAANDPAYAAAAQNVRDSISGKYLNGSPQLDAIVASSRAAAQREAANAAAGAREQYARAGLSFGTPALQALQAAQAAATAKANADETQLRYTNYQAERQNQLQAPQQLAAVQGIPLEYLTRSANSANSLAPTANLLTGLSGGGQVIKPDMIATPSLDSYIMDQIGKL